MSFLWPSQYDWLQIVAVIIIRPVVLKMQNSARSKNKTNLMADVDIYIDG